ncbi:MAG: cysteine--tRNA ligase [PS1 clade bacterium]|nr:cysteine--tRNA ligase [PS1 clade bacterium]
MRRLFLHNNLNRQKEEFQPENAAHVTIYVCGPTVYGPAHIGNARPAVVFDVLVRVLRHLYPAVSYARNITDIDDKINARAAEEGVDIGIITDRYRAKYHEDMAALGVAAPDIEPHATRHVDDIIEMITLLIARGAAYVAEGHVLFDVTQDADYGTLSRRAREDMLAGARVEIAPYKRDAGDFVLWKPSTVDLPGWESPWGRGRPGWHIECSAMIARHFGPTVDIHGGGVDLQFPHHENECAQSRCAHGAPLARYWLHNGMLNIAGEKMSKSRGNITLVEELLGDYPGEAIRLALLQGQYRQPLDFTADLLDQSMRNLDRLYGVLRDTGDVTPDTCEAPDAFLDALCDDLNTPKAMAELFALSKQTDTPKGKGQFLAAANIMGLLEGDPAQWFATDTTALDVALVESLIEKRAQARRVRDFAAADAARDALGELGVTIEDTADGTIWRLARQHGTR